LLGFPYRQGREAGLGGAKQPPVHIRNHHHHQNLRTSIHHHQLPSHESSVASLPPPPATHAPILRFGWGSAEQHLDLQEVAIVSIYAIDQTCSVPTSIPPAHVSALHHRRASMMSASSPTSPLLSRTASTASSRKRGSPYCAPGSPDESSDSNKKPRTSAASTPKTPLHPPTTTTTTTTTTTAISPSSSVESPQKRQRRTEAAVKALPLLYQNTGPADLVILIADMLQELVGLNDRIPLSGAGLTRFHSRFAPPKDGMEG
jgi:hypothetical protein